ncbi:uncharacterized protein LOC114545162 [Dendronephthya gigantea]|uniref:uncharacterized protein LOC114545162 n=1 Tax=Dendronephthya gigantea TaxID=151771 RepID=UPI00106B070F|nr:uncharacterized protein LOC114545162 [Dendronephthya gigantea]
MSISSKSKSVSESLTESDSSVESSVYSTANSGLSRDSNAEVFVPFDDSVEPLASPEEVAEYEEAVAVEQQLENTLQIRFEAQVDVTSWCECGNCSLDMIVKPEECRCCMEISQCRDKMYEHEDEGHQKCIVDHPGFNDVCLNEWVLEIASLGLKTKGHRNYNSVFREGQKTRAEFLRAVSYRQLVRLVWDFTGSSRHIPLPCCCYKRIRSTFPNTDDRDYTGFEDDEDI